MTSQTEFKANIMERLGGESTFDFIVLGFVERLKADPKLEKFFAKYDTDSLVQYQRQFLNIAFTKHSEDYDEESSILFRYCGLIDRGFNADHFDMLLDHLVSAMGDAWVDDEVAAEATGILKSFRGLFRPANSESLLSMMPAKGLYEASVKNPTQRHKKIRATDDDMTDLLEMYNEVLELAEM